MIDKFAQSMLTNRKICPQRMVLLQTMYLMHIAPTIMPLSQFMVRVFNKHLSNENSHFKEHQLF